ncbi:hypothetical protein Bbelb_118560 [Branchiostoma belcheri]|nr:hypothetical protein Bbelb_118560 [Branchiostoma belcheri]
MWHTPLTLAGSGKCGGMIGINDQGGEKVYSYEKRGYRGVMWQQAEASMWQTCRDVEGTSFYQDNGVENTNVLGGTYSRVYYQDIRHPMRQAPMRVLRQYRQYINSPRAPAANSDALTTRPKRSRPIGRVSGPRCVNAGGGLRRLVYVVPACTTRLTWRSHYTITPYAGANPDNDEPGTDITSTGTALYFFFVFGNVVRLMLRKGASVAHFLPLMQQRTTCNDRAFGSEPRVPEFEFCHSTDLVHLEKNSMVSPCITVVVVETLPGLDFADDIALLEDTIQLLQVLLYRVETARQAI